MRSVVRWFGTKVRVGEWGEEREEKEKKNKIIIIRIKEKNLSHFYIRLLRSPLQDDETRYSLFNPGSRYCEFFFYFILFIFKHAYTQIHTHAHARKYTHTHIFFLRRFSLFLYACDDFWDRYWSECERGVSFMPANANKSLRVDSRLSLSLCAEQYLNSPKVGGVYLSSTIYATTTRYASVLGEIKERKKIR